MRDLLRPIALVSALLILAVLASCGASRLPSNEGAPGTPDKKEKSSHSKKSKKQAKDPNALPGDETIKNPEVAYNMALEFAGQENMEAAHHYIELAIRMRTDSKYSYTQGLFYLTEGKYNEAVVHFNRAMTEGAGTQENKLAVRNALGVCYKELGKDEEALKEFRDVVNSPGLFGRYEAYYNMGVIYMRQKKSVDAEAVFMKVVEENPNFYKAYNKLGVLAAFRNDWGSAAISYKKALDLLSMDYNGAHVDGAEIYYNYGEALYHEKLYPQARNALLQVLKISPEGSYGRRAKEVLAQLGGN